MERFYLYSKECAVVGEVYKKQIILMNDSQKETKKLWKSFLSVNKDTEKKLQQEYEKEKAINIQSIINQLLLFFKENQKKFPHIDLREFEFNESRLVQVVKRFCYEFILKKDKDTQITLKNLITIGSKVFTRKDWYKQFATINYNFEVQKDKVVQKNLKQHKYGSLIPQTECQSALKNDNKNISFVLNQDFSNKNNKIWNQEQNSLNDRISNLAVMKGDQSKTFMLNNLKTKDEVTELNNLSIQNQPDISISQISFQPLISNIADKQIEQKIELNFNLNDNDEEEEENLNPFPQIIVKTEHIEQTMQNQFPHLKYDLKLLTEIIILEVSGIQVCGPSRIIPTSGESLHLYSHQLLSAQAFKKDKESSFCYSLKKFFKNNYSPIGLNQNNPLPQWLNCQIINGIIHLWGTPKANDEPEILVKIVDQLKFTILSYPLFIKDKEGIDLKEKRKSFGHQLKKNNLDMSFKSISSKNQVQMQNICSQIQINQQYIQDTDKKLGNLSSKLSKFSKDLQISQKSPNNLILNSKNYEISTKLFDTLYDKKTDFKTETDHICIRDQSLSEPYQISSLQNKQKIFSLGLFKNQKMNEFMIQNQIDNDKILDLEEDQARDYDEKKVIFLILKILFELIDKQQEDDQQRKIAISNFSAKV